MKNLILIAIFLPLTIINCDKSSPQPDKPSTIARDNPVPASTVGEKLLQFTPIPQLPANWWEDGAEKAYEVWDRNTLYLWGANKGNYTINDPEQSLGGSGLAGKNGPTRGHGHPHYIGVITTSLSKTQNEEVFDNLRTEQQKGENIVVPITHEGRWALGTGIALQRFGNDARAWKNSQYYLLGHVLELARNAKRVDFGSSTYWPDCSTVGDDCKVILASSPMALKLRSINDLERIKNYTLAMSKSELIGWKFPSDVRVHVGPENFYGLPPKASTIDTAFSAFTMVLYKAADGSFEILTQARNASKSIETPGGHLTGGQSWQEGAIDELEQESGIALAKEALIYLAGGNNPANRVNPNPIGNANFLVVFADIKPKTIATSPEIDQNYGHRWLSLKDVYKEVAQEENLLGPTKNGKYYRFFRSHVINFCNNNVKNLGVCE